MKYSLFYRVLKTADIIIPRDIPSKQQKQAVVCASNGIQTLRSYCELFKIKIALFAALSAATASVLVIQDVTAGMLLSAAGVFLLACGAGTLNQFQESERDALMMRTRSRPIPSGRIAPVNALYAAVFLFLSGFLMLSLTGSLTASGFGIFAVVWYNLVYTKLKQVTAFAAVPGALTGAVPPAIGWIAAGGSLSDIRLAAICFFFFMWQVPHFWLLLLSHAEDFRKSQIPSINKVFGWAQLTTITAVWMSAAAVSSLFIPFFGVSVPAVVIVSLLSAAAWLAWNSLTLCRQKEQKSAFDRTFRIINVYMVVVMVLLNAGSLFEKIELSPQELLLYFVG